MDKKNSKILSILDKNCRASLKEISDELYISKQAVLNRLKDLESKEISSYLTIINYFELGYSNLHLYLKIQGIKEKEYYKKVKLIENMLNVKWVADFIGEFDMGISIFYKNFDELYLTIKKIYGLVGKFVKKKEIYFIIKQFVPKINKMGQREIIRVENLSLNNFKLEKKDIELLDKIQSDARYNYSNLSEKLKMSRISVSRKINRLEKGKIILGYKPFLNYSSMGYNWSLCIIKLFPGKDYKKLIGSILSNDNVPFASLTIDGDILLDFKSLNNSEIKNFLNEIKFKYKDKIEEYKVLVVNKVYKMKIL